MLLPFVFLVLFRDRRRMVHSSVTEHPSAEWTGRQLVAAFPRDTVPRYLIRDRDGIYGQHFTRCVHAVGIKQVLIAPMQHEASGVAILRSDTSC